MMNWTNLLNELFDIVEELADDKQLPAAEKLEILTDAVMEAIEAADDAVLLLPAGFAIVAKLLVDNPAIDGYQRDLLAKPLAEAVYQLWKMKQQLLGKV